MTLIKNRYVTTRAQVKKSKQLALCTQCGDIQYKGFWYASDSQLALMINEDKDSVSYSLCPACQMQNKGSCAGLVHVKYVPKNMLSSVLAIMQKAVEQDSLENPQHRVLEVSVANDGYTLKTTSSSMAKNIGRKILDACEMCEAKSIYRKEPESLYVTDIVFSIPGYFSQALQK